MVPLWIGSLRRWGEKVRGGASRDGGSVRVVVESGGGGEVV
jgi:hypothetical protein